MFAAAAPLGIQANGNRGGNRVCGAVIERRDIVAEKRLQLDQAVGDSHRLQIRVLRTQNRKQIVIVRIDIAPLTRPIRPRQDSSSIFCAVSIAEPRTPVVTVVAARVFAPIIRGERRRSTLH